MVIRRALGAEFRKRFPLPLLRSIWTHPTRQRHLNLFASSWTPHYYESYKKFCRSTSNTCIGQVPSMGESITEGVLSSWSKEVGDVVNKDDVLAIIDTDKVSVDIHSIAQGCLIDQKAKAGDAVFVGQDLYVLDLSIEHEKADETVHEKPRRTEDSTSSTKTQSIPQDVSEPSHKPSEKLSEVPSAASQDDKRRQKTLETCQHNEGSNPKSEKKHPEDSTREKTHKKKPTNDLNTLHSTSERQEIVVPMTRLRKTIAHRLKMAQNVAASLTTFNECDMTNVMAMRTELQEEFIKRHGYKLGFVSFFLHAASRALLQSPEMNAYISENGEDIIYKNYVDISVAVSTPSGLLVPVLRDCHKKSIAGLEAELQKYAEKAREGKISLGEMTGGTFTISNGGIFGSLMGTPLLNYPQTSILGLHSITPRAAVVKNEVVARPLMYLALTYDHRLVDGKEAVTFLNTIKKDIEDPRRLLLDL